MKTYLITSGSFRLDDGSVKHAGETIELHDDVAALHAPQLQLQAQAQAQAPAAEAAIEQQPV